MPHDSEQHAQHDPLLVVSLAAGDLSGADRDLASSLISDCADCATLHDDLLAIARATAAIPPAVRPRDFQLSPEQAAHLRPAGWRRFVAAFAAPRMVMTRQLGIGLTTLGLAGLLVSVLPTISVGSPASAPAAANPALSGSESVTDAGIEAAPSPAASAAAAAASDPVTVSGGERPSASYDDSLLPLASPHTDRNATGGTRTGTDGNLSAQGPKAGDTSSPDLELFAAPPSEGQGVSLILVASAIFLAAGIALLIARRIARGVTGV
jgi:hypothetical protein